MKEGAGGGRKECHRYKAGAGAFKTMGRFFAL
jgi:hypothetical protein